jgi:hypothetical protein
MKMRPGPTGGCAGRSDLPLVELELDMPTLERQDVKCYQNLQEFTNHLQVNRKGTQLAS